MNYNEYNDETLVNITLLGDKKAYETLVTRYQRHVINAAYSVTENFSMAEDAAQDAFVSAWIKLDSLREPEKYRSWVSRIAKNCAKNIIVRYKDFVSLDSDIGVHFDGYISDFAENEDLYEGVDKLSDKLKKVVDLHYFKGFSIAEIAEQLNLPTGTVKRRLHDSRKKIGAFLGYTDMEENLLVETVMKKVDELIHWQTRSSKENFDKVYEDVLRCIENLPESPEKYHCMADVLLRGYWWLPGEHNRELIEEIRAAAEKGDNKEVLAYLIRCEERDVSEDQKISFILEKQMPRIEKLGLPEALGEEWFWLGYEYMKKQQIDLVLDAFSRVEDILPPDDVYHANARAAARFLELSEGHDSDSYEAIVCGEQYKKEKGKLVFWSQPGFSRGKLIRARGDHPIGCVMFNASGCDGIFYDEDMKPGETIRSADGKISLIYEKSGVTADTLCGTFDDCDCWVTESDKVTIRTYYKRGIGIVLQEHRYQSGFQSCYTLKDIHIEGGSGLLPFVPGNYWEYDAGLDNRRYLFLHRYDVTSLKGNIATTSMIRFCRRLPNELFTWEDLMLRMKYEYCTATPAGQCLKDVSKIMEQAEMSAITQWQKTCTYVAVLVMKRIFDTSPQINENCSTIGLWNFFSLSAVHRDDGKIRLVDDRSFSFEWKDMKKTPPPGYPLLYNDLFGVLSDVAGCVWSDEWKKDCVIRRKGEGSLKDADVRIHSTRVDMVETSTDCFENCLMLSIHVTGDVPKGIAYRTGEMEYYFASGIGIVRFVHYNRSAKVKSVYDLTSFVGTKEGFMPVEDGMIRRYEAVDMTDGYVGATEYIYCTDDTGLIRVLQNRTGIKKLQKKGEGYG